MASSSVDYIPFRKKLIFFAAIIIAIIAIPVLLFEIQRPWQELDRSIQLSNSIIGPVQESISDEELLQMISFTEQQIASQSATAMPKHLDWTFTMYLLEGRLLSEKEIQQTLQQRNKQQEFSYTEVTRAYRYWETLFSEQPEMGILLRSQKQYLQQVVVQAERTGLDLADVYILLDSGSGTGDYANAVYFVLDGYNWYESSYPGDLYPLSTSSLLRQDAFNNIAGFNHNRRIDPENWFLPGFYTDQWGNWFSVWYTRPVDSMATIFVVDFNAASVLGMMRSIAAITLGLAGILLLIVLLIVRVLSERYARSPFELSKGIQHVGKGDYEYRVPPLYDEFESVRTAFNRMTGKLKERDRLQQVLEKLLSKELAEVAAEKGLLLGGEETECTLMFTDFAGFSTITETLQPSEIVHALNDYFEVLIPIIKHHGGFPDKYIGDAIVSIFGAPLRFENHAQRAVACAIEMQEAMRMLNTERLKKKQIVFEMRVGLNTGNVLVGAIGCDMKLEYTSIGESTNLANRMEAACSIGNILMSSKTYAQLGTDTIKYPVVIRKVQVKGYATPIQAHEITVSPVLITKNPHPSGAHDFYWYGQS
jgi:class 3 adenylate cyclase